MQQTGCTRAFILLSDTCVPNYTKESKGRVFFATGGFIDIHRGTNAEKIAAKQGAHIQCRLRSSAIIATSIGTGIGVPTCVIFTLGLHMMRATHPASPSDCRPQRNCDLESLGATRSPWPLRWDTASPHISHPRAMVWQPELLHS